MAGDVQRREGLGGLSVASIREDRGAQIRGPPSRAAGVIAGTAIRHGTELEGLMEDEQRTDVPEPTAEAGVVAEKASSSARGAAASVLVALAVAEGFLFFFCAVATRFRFAESYSAFLFKYPRMAQALVVAVWLYALSALVSEIIGSKKLAAFLGATLDRAMKASLVFGCIFAWQVFAAAYWLDSADVRLITPGGEVPIWPAYAALVAVIASAVASFAALVLARKWKDAVGWALIATIVGFFVALES